MATKETKWYCLRVVSNKERKIKERLEHEIRLYEYQDLIPRIIVPTEKVYKIKNGKKEVKERTLTPGYIFVEAIVKQTKGGPKTALDANIIQLITNVKDVMHFIGKKNPIPIREHEVKQMLNKVDESSESGELLVEPFLVGEEIKVTDGQFIDYMGIVKEVNEEKKRLTIITKVFGRETEVELDFMQVEKQS